MILTTSYFPSITYFRLLKNSSGIVEIEATENYQKQSYRNRFKIAGDKGVQILTLPVHSFNNIPIKDVTVDYSMPWQREHKRAVKTCYGSAPYFAYIMDGIDELFSLKEKYLLDYNNRILQRLLEIVHKDMDITTLFTKSYTPLEENDTRLITSRNYKDPTPTIYYQVFSEKVPFIADLSIIDYLMCEGPDISLI